MTSEVANGPSSVLDVPHGVVYESARPLSQSLIWTIQSTYYDGHGIDAWASGDVPHMLTSGPILARSYARSIAALMADALDGNFGRVDTDEPVYIVELGAGTGRLGFFVLQALEGLAKPPFRPVYVFSDRVRANVEFWSNHPKLAPYFERGLADVAVFDPVTDTEIRLERSGTTITAASAANPLVVIANYFFDVISQDLYVQTPEGLYEELIAVCAESAALDISSASFLNEIFLASEVRAVEPDRYGDWRDDQLRASAARHRSSGERFLFPKDALSCLRHLLDLTDARALFLIGERPGALARRDELDDAERATDAGNGSDADAGAAATAIGQSTLSTGTTSQARRPGAVLAMGVHGGSLSLPVDLATLADVELGTLLLVGPAPPTGLSVNSMVFGANEAVPSIREAFSLTVAEQGPEDIYLAIKAAADHGGESTPLHMLLALVRLGGYDPYLFRQLYLAIQGVLADAPEHLVDEAVRVFGRVWQSDFPIDDATDVAYAIASLLAPIGRYADALAHFTRSIERRGERAETLYNIALCHLHLERPQDALDALRRAVAADGTYLPGVELYHLVAEEQRRRAT